MTTHVSLEASPPSDTPGGGLAAVLFDMDGTLIDSEPLWTRTAEEVCARFGYTWSLDDQRRTLGGSLGSTSAYMAERMPAPVDAAQVRALLAKGFRRRITAGAPPRPGAVELLSEVAEAGVPTALVTSTHRTFIDSALGRLGACPFTVSVAGDEVERAKPDPEPYRTAAHRLGVDPARCVAVEDSPTGAASALAAGCTTLVVPHAVPVDHAPGSHIVASLTEVDLDTLRGLIPLEGRSP